MKVSIFGLSLALLLICLSQCSAIYFEISGGAEKCFLEEVPRDTLVIGDYKVEDSATPVGTPSNLGLTVRIIDPENNPISDRSYPSSGRFAFTTQIGGEHQVCVSTNSSRWFGPAVKARIYMDIESGVAANDYDAIAKAEHLTSLEISVRRLNDRVAAIRKEQAYQRGREITFRNTSESTNARVMWWSVLQLVVLVASGVFQMRHLKSFFKAKKLV
eukprot:TRINITY_DN1300_c0_g1_i1.p1 TRINITY_DN1300_c0_g1~~TRINITY_DN1300_c0_g1_i1.p1  ORF type:complete len:216 (+),score=35.38 TRINITY_DN1300_c0_g1_i1:143-790(+)